MSPEVAGKLTDAFAAVDTIFREFHESGVTPDVAYGVIAEGRLHHAGGFGDTSLGVGPERRIYRIASMTKSFTASALLILRDRGLLALDAPVSDYVPELRDLALPTTDSSPITLRDLVTMSAGLPTDDPWADRMESMTAAAFSDLLREGFRFCSVPQSGFEYSNLGFAILGRAIANVSGAAYQDFVAATVLEPLGLVDTGYDAKTLDPDRLVVGHRRSQDRWEALPFSGPGEFSPIGGLFSTVSDLSRWVLYLLDAYPPRGDRDDGPLRRSSRREMQGMHRLDVVSAGLDLSAAPGRPARVNGVAEGYGFGLFVQRVTERGDVAPTRRLSRVRFAHAVAPAHRPRCHRARQRHVRRSGTTLRTGARRPARRHVASGAADLDLARDTAGAWAGRVAGRGLRRHSGRRHLQREHGSRRATTCTQGAARGHDRSGWPRGSRCGDQRDLRVPGPPELATAGERCRRTAQRRAEPRT